MRRNASSEYHARGDRENRRDVVEVVHQRLTDVERLDAKRPGLGTLLLNVNQTRTQQLVYLLLQRVVEIMPPPLDRRGDVVVDRQCGPHAPKHRPLDALMSTLPR
jgi:hypothetical protein